VTRNQRGEQNGNEWNGQVLRPELVQEPLSSNGIDMQAEQLSQASSL